MGNGLEDILLSDYEPGPNYMASYDSAGKTFSLGGQKYSTKPPPISPAVRSEQFGEKVYQAWPESLAKTLVGGATGWAEKFPYVKPDETPREKGYRLAEEAGFSSAGLLRGAKGMAPVGKVVAKAFYYHLPAHGTFKIYATSLEKAKQKLVREWGLSREPRNLSIWEISPEEKEIFKYTGRKTDISEATPGQGDRLQRGGQKLYESELGLYK